MAKTRRSRVYLTVSPELIPHLERWAEQESRPLANMATYLIERDIRAAIASGELPVEDTAVSKEADLAVRSVLRKIVRGEQLTPGEVAIAADEIDVDSGDLMRRAEKSRGENGAKSNC